MAPLPVWVFPTRALGQNRRDRDRADMHIAIVNQPAFFASFRTAVSGEGGHMLLKRGAGREAS
jgi:hypothetical protein